MASFQHFLVLLLVVAAATVLARWLPWPRPITYLLSGLAAGLAPGFPAITLDPEIFFLCFLPPLLFYDGWLMPLRDFVRATGQIVLLATGLVALTAVGVGLVAHSLVPALPLAMAFALGAVVSPTDAVAVSAITQRLKVPSRLRIVLEGESLLNDATGLVAFNFALAAVVAGGVSLGAMTAQFFLLAAGGLVLGFVVAYAIGQLRDLLRRAANADPLIETMLSLLTPFAAYLPAAALGWSGILAVVAAGLYSGWRDPVRTDAETRQAMGAVWTALVFWLNGLAFVLLGLQLPAVFAAVAGEYSWLLLAGSSGAVLGVTMLLRVLWVFPGTYLPYVLSRRIRQVDERPSWAAVFAGGWAGMRGTVTLAAALSIPLTLPGGQPFPGRDLVIFLASAVVVGTLLIQGGTMEMLIRWLRLQEDPGRREEDRLARLAAVEAGLRALRSDEATLAGPDAAAALGHVIAEYEQRLSELVAEGESRTHARQRVEAEKQYRCRALVAEREAIDALWQANQISDEIHRPLQQLLDHEEALLSGRRRALGQQAE